MDRGWKPNVEISLSCPRCGSSNTKFCYYNNYSLTQPRYFCKACRRYWTKGGSLRNVPVGGGCRKNRRGKSLRISTSDVAHSRSFGYRGAFSNKWVSSVECCSSSMTSDGSLIDLALVYANFLNPHQPPNSQSTTAATTTGFEMQELGTSDFDPSLDFTTIPNSNLESTSVQLHEDNHNSLNLAGCLATISGSYMEAPLNDNVHHLMYYCGVNSQHMHQADDNKVQQCISTHHESIHYGLPPLPGEEIGSHPQILCSNSHLMSNDHTLQVTQEPVVGPEKESNLMFGNWDPFDFSIDNTVSSNLYM
ncbi:hypothetical protein GH714_042412 [Hevea brasiliensis]|uniref:Dof zinc finger protein n=1 Tax=Hevea brasiliensis TaxID=3981 RepID=A0A6A6NFB4_HEVBR|nr:hypothetical protein GH714_042412 [Hevea brasiliensis]